MKAGMMMVGLVLVVSTAMARFDRGPEVQPQADPRSSEATPAHSASLGLADVEGRESAGSEVLWVRPDGPLRVALQAGHWKASEAPDEQARLRTNGTRGGGKAEWEVNLEIAQRTAALLEEAGYDVEILPTTIPPGYWADLFISIHADGHPNPTTSGFRAAAPRRDVTGKARDFVAILEQRYGEATGLRRYPTVTRRMTGYYAFNWRRYEHALHPMTVGVILETGFLTSPSDRRVIVDAQELPARGIADAVKIFGEQLVLDAKPQPMPRVVRAPQRLRFSRETTD